MSQAETISALRVVPLFGSCSRRQLKHIAANGWEQTYEPGQILCEQGAMADDFFVILEGDADVRRGDRRVNSLGAGDYFGELALLRTLIGRSPRTATVQAVTPMRCFLLGRSEFQKVLYEEDIAVKILRAVVQRLDATSAL